VCRGKDGVLWLGMAAPANIGVAGWRATLAEGVAPGAPLYRANPERNALTPNRKGACGIKQTWCQDRPG
jgi:hypothetical protein